MNRLCRSAWNNRTASLSSAGGRAPLETLRSDWQGTRLLCYGLLLADGRHCADYCHLLYQPSWREYDPRYHRLCCAWRSASSTAARPLDVVRTPGYPLFIDLFGGAGHLEMVSIAQGGLFILTALEMYLLAWLIWKRAWIGLLIGLIVVSDMYLLSYVKPIISEGLTLWQTASLALAAVWYMQRVSARRLWLVAFLLLWLFMTRPEWVYLPVLLLAYLLFVAARRKQFRHLLPHVLIAAVVLYGLLGLFIYENTVQYGYTGITRHSKHESGRQNLAVQHAGRGAASVCRCDAACGCVSGGATGSWPRPLSAASGLPSDQPE